MRGVKKKKIAGNKKAIIPQARSGEKATIPIIAFGDTIAAFGIFNFKEIILIDFCNNNI